LVRLAVEYVNKIPVDDVIHYPPVLELMSRKEFDNFKMDLLPLKLSLLHDE